MKTTARFSTLNLNRRDKENWKPGRLRQKPGFVASANVSVNSFTLDIGSHASVQLAEKIGHF